MASFPTCSPVQQLPPEILLLIFSEFRWDGSEPSVPVGNDCAWFQFVRLQKTLSLVCRTWNHIAMPMLYSIVYLHRVGQLVALVRTLDERLATKREIVHYVEQIRCTCFVPLIWDNVYREGILRLVTHCRTIRKLVYTPTFDDRIAEPFVLDLLFIHPFDEPFPNLLELSIGEPMPTVKKLRIGLSCFQKLNKLHLSVDVNLHKLGNNVQVFLPNLETLTCDFLSHQAYSSGTRTIANHWILPELRNLSAILTWAGGARNERTSLLPLQTLCATHGSRLHALHLEKRISHLDFSASLSCILKLCPELIHITYPYELLTELLKPTMPPSTPVHSALRRVTFLSVFLSDCPQGPTLHDHLMELSDRSAFPSIDTIVVLDPRLQWTPVDARTLPPMYSKILIRWSGILNTLGIRLLNCESQPVNIVPYDGIEDIDLVNTDESDEDFQYGPNESSSDSDDYDDDNVDLVNTDESDEDFLVDHSESSSDSDDYRSDSSSGTESMILRANPKTEAPRQLDVAEALETFESTLRPLGMDDAPDAGGSSGKFEEVLVGSSGQCN